MKTRLLITTLAVALLAGGITAQAETAHKMTQAQMAEMCKTMDPEGCRMMMREMVKNKALHKPMAEELSKNTYFGKAWHELHNH